MQSETGTAAAGVSEYRRSTRPPVHLVQSKAVTVSHREWSEAAAAVSLEYSMAGRRPAHSAASVRPNPSILISAWPGTEQQTPSLLCRVTSSWV